MTSKDDSIFVQIASYRDPECQWTVKDLFDKADNPDRITVGICWQFVPEEDSDCFQVTTRPERVWITEVHAKDSRGVCWARSQTQQLWGGEKYTLQIDSHMRFEPGWDTLLTDMLAQCASERPVLSTYPPGYTPPNNLEKKYIFAMRPKAFNEEGTLLLTSVPIPVDKAPEKPIRGTVSSACFLFGEAKIIKEVPYDPYLYFFGEEISLAVRLWTNGWDIFHPNKLVAYHYWSRRGRVTHFDDHEDWTKLNKRAQRRVAHMLGVEKSSDPEVLMELNRYGLGSRRTLAQYCAFSGINFRMRTLPEKDLGKLSEKGNGRDKEVTMSKLSKTRDSAKAIRRKRQKVFESRQIVVFDDFLSDNDYESIFDFSCCCDYKHINTEGRVSRVWRPRDGFPLRSLLNLFYYSDDDKKPDEDWVYPTNTAFDLFAENLIGVLPEVETVIGKMARDWNKFSVTSWMYPVGSGLSVHDDGVNYAGAYVYFLNRQWNIHWGGLLLTFPQETSLKIDAHKEQTGAYRFVRKKWSDDEEENSLFWDPGFAQCILPKRNRIVFIANDAFHLVTTVNPSAGDNVRRSLAGFFDKNQ